MAAHPPVVCGGFATLRFRRLTTPHEIDEMFSARTVAPVTDTLP